MNTINESLRLEAICSTTTGETSVTVPTMGAWWVTAETIEQALDRAKVLVRRDIRRRLDEALPLPPVSAGSKTKKREVRREITVDIVDGRVADPPDRPFPAVQVSVGDFWAAAARCDLEDQDTEEGYLEVVLTQVTEMVGAESSNLGAIPLKGIDRAFIKAVLASRLAEWCAEALIDADEPGDDYSDDNRPPRPTLSVSASGMSRRYQNSLERRLKSQVRESTKHLVDQSLKRHAVHVGAAQAAQVEREAAAWGCPYHVSYDFSSPNGGIELRNPSSDAELQEMLTRAKRELEDWETRQVSNWMGGLTRQRHIQAAQAFLLRWSTPGPVQKTKNV